MFKFFSWFKSSKVPTVSATREHKIDDKKRHDQFFIELKEGLEESLLFKSKYIKGYLGLYKKYEPFKWEDASLIYKAPQFFESLTELGKTYESSEIKKYVDNIANIAINRSYTKVELERLTDVGLFDEVKLIFLENRLLCANSILEKKKYHNKNFAIKNAPIFPLKTCFKCSSCRLGVQYRTDIFNIKKGK